MGNLIYDKALKAGQKVYRNAIAKGNYPYLPALDDFLERGQIQSERNLGLVDIPIEQIVGTKTVGRQHAFAANFMPLMEEGTEFEAKWSSLYEYQTSEGINDPIVAYEFMNKFYVMEGNKRVSVFKFLESPTIEGYVTRLIPYPNDTKESRIYFEFLDFYNCTKINDIWFSREEGFSLLLKTMGKNIEEQWSLEDRRLFSSNYNKFLKVFYEKGGKKLSITPGDAFLFYLTIYSYDEIVDKSAGEFSKEIDRIWKELTELGDAPEDALVMNPKENAAGLIKKLVNLTTQGIGNKTLKVAFIHDRTTENSSWTYGHELGRTHLDEVFGERIETRAYCCQSLELDITKVLELAIQEGNQVIFTTHQTFIGASLKAALAHPEIKILNCSVNRPYASLRTYFGRMYEVKFLCGLVAGAMTENNRIAYRADYPIYGTCAGINAFALGARMTNPRAKIYLYWNSCKEQNFDEFLEKHDISIISDSDMIRPNSDRKFGLYKILGDTYQALMTPIWDWGKFYEKIIREIFAGSWSKNAESNGRKAVNYWWGISSGIIGEIMSQHLETGLKRLVWIIQNEINSDRLKVFTGEIYKQDGTLVIEDGETLTPEQIINMDWLADNVVGAIPDIDSLTDEAKTLVMQQGNLSELIHYDNGEKNENISFGG